MIENDNKMVWKETPVLWMLFAIAVGLLIFVYSDALSKMVGWWETREEYGHGYLIPPIAAFLIWQKKNLLEKIEFKTSWLGVFIVAVGFFMFYAGNLSAIYIVMQYAFMVTLSGAILSLIGIKAYKVILVPMLIPVFMIPLPSFILNNLSSQLQLLSSEIGVAFIRLFDISVYLEGNVIDLGVYKLQVVEACSGLNYLFPLMTLGFICAYFFTGAFWKKVIIFLTTIPITILMNSFRIGVIGIMVEYWGIEMAEGFLHDFEGWAVFMGCIGLLVLEMWVLASIGKDKLPLRDAFGLDFPEPSPKGHKEVKRKVSKSFYISLIIIVFVAGTVHKLPEREEIFPDRKSFTTFPLEIDEWSGRATTLEKIYLNALKLTDYVLVDYSNDNLESVNFYSAYYKSQKKGASIHSPKSCIPGGGWIITNSGTHSVQNVNIGDVPLTVNRLVISQGEQKQLVYYWFQQRGRIITNEYIMKIYQFWDAATKSRTDGALIRLTTILGSGQDIKIADERLTSFTKKISPILEEYVPE